MFREMIDTVSQTMFTTCVKVTEHLHTVVTKLSTKMSNNEFSETTQQINALS